MAQYLVTHYVECVIECDDDPTYEDKIRYAMIDGGWEMLESEGFDTSHCIRNEVTVEEM